MIGRFSTALFLLADPLHVSLLDFHFRDILFECFSPRLEALHSFVAVFLRFATLFAPLLSSNCAVEKDIDVFACERMPLRCLKLSDLVDPPQYLSNSVYLKKWFDADLSWSHSLIRWLVIAP